MACFWAFALFLATGSNAVSVASFGFGGKPITTTSTAAALHARGGESDAETTLRRFAQESDQTGKFLIQGWRWHTLSVQREAERLQKLAERMDQTGTVDLARLRDAVNYVIGFNLKALHRVEAMFFPKMKKLMSESKMAEPELRKAFDKVVSSLEQDKKKLAALGESITQSVEGSSPDTARTVATKSGEVVALIQSMLDREINLVMPVVGICVGQKDQKRFNNQVIKFLGVLESRCHLVHMHEVVAAANSLDEKKLWEESIPSLPRSMIPRWKRTLYEPKARALCMP